jgi:hypothetical protein
MAHFPRTRVATGQLTQAQLQFGTGAGTVIIPPRAGSNIRVLDGWLRAIGSAIGACTAIVVEDTGGTDVISATAGTLLQNVVARCGASGVTVTNLGATLGMGKGLRIGWAGGSAATVTTGLDYCIKYVYEPVNNAAS